MRRVVRLRWPLVVCHSMNDHKMLSKRLGVQAAFYFSRVKRQHDGYQTVLRRIVIIVDWCRQTWREFGPQFWRCSVCWRLLNSRSLRPSVTRVSRPARNSVYACFFIADGDNVSINYTQIVRCQTPYSEIWTIFKKSARYRLHYRWIAAGRVVFGSTHAIRCSRIAAVDLPLLHIITEASSAVLQLLLMDLCKPEPFSRPCL